MQRSELTEQFYEIYGRSGGVPRLFFAPGRVNLIGEHTDYNGGHVFPCALSLGIYAAVRPREDRQVRLYSEKRSETGIVDVSLDAIAFQKEAHWANYPLGVFDRFEKDGRSLPFGMDILYQADMPVGAGLGSSAAIEVLTGLLIRELCGFDDLTMMGLAESALISEHEFMGVPCGIMDPVVTAEAHAGEAIFMSTSPLKLRYVPLHMEGCRIVITDTRIHHHVANSDYNRRKEECERALRKLQSVANIRALCDLSPERFESCKDVIMDPVLIRRAHHVVYENVRCVRALSALRVSKIDLFGRLMNESHASLRDNYEVSCPELDFLQAEAVKLPGVIGSRMMGAGFGGCTVSIVRENTAEDFMRQMDALYAERFGIHPGCWMARTGDGAREIKEDQDGV